MKSDSQILASTLATSITEKWEMGVCVDSKIDVPAFSVLIPNRMQREKC